MIINNKNKKHDHAPATKQAGQTVKIVARLSSADGLS
jgi:hypothetical protein